MHPPPPHLGSPCVPSLGAVARSGVPSNLLPKALIPIIFLPWGVQVGYAVEKRIGVEAGPFTRIVRSDAVQKGGPTMRRMDKTRPPKVKGVRLTPAAADITKSFKKQYPTRSLELLWDALIKCYGNQERALAAVTTNPQMLNPSYSFPNTLLESKRILLGVMSEADALEVRRLNPLVALGLSPRSELVGSLRSELFDSYGPSRIGGHINYPSLLAKNRPGTGYIP